MSLKVTRILPPIASGPVVTTALAITFPSESVKSNSGSVLHSGDYFDITLPNNLTFPPGYSEPQFDLTDSEGNVIARAVVTTGPEAIGGKIRVTFNDKINNKYDVKGKLYLGALFNKNSSLSSEVGSI